MQKSCEVNIPVNRLVRGCGGFDPSWKSVEVDIPCNVLVRGGGEFETLREVVKLISQSTYWSEGVADLIP